MGGGRSLSVARVAQTPQVDAVGDDGVGMDWEVRALAAEAALLAARARIGRLETQLARLADRDPLTGLLNRVAFEDAVGTHTATAARYGAEGALLMVRVDGLDAVRAVAGVDAADLILEAAADHMRSVLRTTDVVARWGIDELAVLLPRSSGDAAARVAAKLVDAVAAASTDRLARGTVRANVGAASVDVSGDADDLVVRATTRMLSAVRGGRPVVVEPVGVSRR